MQGKGLDDSSDNKELRGLQPRVFDYIFERTNYLKKTNLTDFIIRCSYFEIYNEQIIDLVK